LIDHFDCLLFLFGCVATPVPRFISFELLRGPALRCGFFANFRHISLIAVLWIEGVVYLALEVAAAMKPRADADENAAVEPFCSVVAVGNAVIGSVVIVTIGTIRGNSDVDGNLSLYFGSSCYKEDSSNSS